MTSPNCRPACVSDAEVDFTYAGGIAKGGKATDAELLDGLDASAFAPVAHDHDATYFTESELQSAGVVNTGGNPVDWTKLKSVPAGFEDGVDNAGGDILGVNAGTGLGGGGASGTVTLLVESSYRLPQGCAANRVPRWSGSSWVCSHGILQVGTVSVDVGTVSAGDCVTSSVAITGLSRGDLGHLFPTLNFPSGGLTIYTLREVATDDRLFYTVCNISSAAINPLAGSWGYYVVRP